MLSSGEQFIVEFPFIEKKTAYSRWPNTVFSLMISTKRVLLLVLSEVSSKNPGFQEKRDNILFVECTAQMLFGEISAFGQCVKKVRGIREYYWLRSTGTKQKDHPTGWFFCLISMVS